MGMLKNAESVVGAVDPVTSFEPQMVQHVTPHDIVRHAAAIFLIFLAQRSLAEWYVYQQNWQLIIFLSQLAGVIIIASFPAIKQTWNFLAPSRVLLAGFILFLAIPWGELLRLNFANTRENWAYQLWSQTVFVYGALLCFKIFPGVPEFLHRHTLGILETLASRRFVLYLPAILLFALSSWICISIYNQTPVVNDSSSYLFQAKIFREGRFFAPTPPVRDFFSYDIDMLIMNNGKWFSMYPPGFAMLLAAAMFVKGEWYLAPLLGALTVAIWIEYARRWYGPRLALLLGCFCLFSPFIFQISSTILIHVPELFIASGVIYICRRQTEQPSIARNILLLLLLCLAIPVRAYSLMVFLSPVLAYTFWTTTRRRFFSVPAAIVLGLALGLLTLSLYQWQTTGSPWSSAYSLEYKNLKYGFGTNYAGQIHTPLRGLELISNNILGLNHWLSGWYSGSLFFLCALFLCGGVLGIWDRLLLGSAMAIILFYFAYFFQDLIFGPRFFYVLAPFLLLLVARSTGIDSSGPITKTQRILTALLVVSFLSFLPTRFSQFLRIYNPSNDPPEYLKTKVNQLGAAKVLVFLEPQVSQDYINWNDPFLRGNRIILRDLSHRNQQAIAAFPEYQPFYFRLKNPSFRAMEGEENYGFYEHPDGTNPSEISFFHMALTLQAGNDFPEKDSFDLTYPRFLSLRGALGQMRFVEKELQQTEQEADGYKKDFKRGIIHCTKMMLLPKLTFEENPAGWKQGLDPEAFRRELRRSMQFFSAAGETGKPLLRQMQKVEKRIDQNDDRVLTDKEVIRYVSEKILYLVKF